MIDFKKMKYFLNNQVKQENRGILISQEKYAIDNLQNLKWKIAKPLQHPWY